MILGIRWFKPLLFIPSNYFLRHTSYVCGGMPDVKAGSETSHISGANVNGKKKIMIDV